MKYPTQFPESKIQGKFKFMQVFFGKVKFLDEGGVGNIPHEWQHSAWSPH